MYKLKEDSCERLWRYFWIEPNSKELYIHEQTCCIIGGSYLKKIELKNMEKVIKLSHPGVATWLFYGILIVNLMMKWMTIRIRVFCWVWISRRIRGCVLGWRAPRRLLSRWRRHTSRGRSPWGRHAVRPSWLSRLQHHQATSYIPYQSVFVGLGDVDDVSEGGNDVDVDTSEWVYFYPSSEMVFWNDIRLDLIQ